MRVQKLAEKSHWKSLVFPFLYESFFFFVDCFRCARIQPVPVCLYPYASVCFEWFCTTFPHKFFGEIVKTATHRRVVFYSNSMQNVNGFFDFWSAFFGIRCWPRRPDCDWLFELLLFNQNGFYKRISHIRYFTIDILMWDLWIWFTFMCVDFIVGLFCDRYDSRCWYDEMKIGWPWRANKLRSC